MIQTDAVSKTYGRRTRAAPAIARVSLRLDPGTWGVVGPNGAGKTTLLGLLLGFLRPSAGSVTIQGASPRAWVRRHGAAYLPERFRLPGAWPVRSALRAFARLDGPGRDTDRVVERQLERLGLTGHADRPFGTLSRGLAQRVGLAQTLLADHRLVVLDEPTAGLDPLWRIRFREIVAGWTDRTVILASHDLAEVERLADRVIVLDRGHVSDILDARPREAGPLTYRLIVDAGADVTSVFPDARPEPAGDARSGSSDARPLPGSEDARRGLPGGRAPRGFVVTVDDAGELSHRIAALLAGGATLFEVTPLSDDLEARVRQRLEDR